MSDQQQPATTTESAADAGASDADVSAVMDQLGIRRESAADAEPEAEAADPKRGADGKFKAKPKADEKPAEEPAAEAEPEAEAEAKPDEPEREAWKDQHPAAAAALARKRQRQAEAARAEADAALAKLQQQRAELERDFAPLREMAQLMRARQPDKAFERLAELSGLTPEQAFQAATERRLKNGQPGEVELQQRLDAVEKQLADERKARADAEQAQRQAQQQEQYSTAIQAQAKRVAAVRDNPDEAVHVPYLAQMPAAWIERESAAIIRAANRAGEAVDWTRVAHFLNDEAKPFVDEIQQRNPRVQVESSPAGNGKSSAQASGAVKPAKPLTNSGAAERSGTKREPTDAERRREIMALVGPELFGG